MFIVNEFNRDVAAPEELLSLVPFRIYKNSAPPELMILVAAKLRCAPWLDSLLLWFLGLLGRKIFFIDLIDHL